MVFSMDRENAVELDGYTGKFFTKAWDIIAHNVYEAVLSFFCEALLPWKVTSTSIVS